MYIRFYMLFLFKGHISKRFLNSLHRLSLHEQRENFTGSQRAMSHGSLHDTSNHEVQEKRVENSSKKLLAPRPRNKREKDFSERVAFPFASVHAFSGNLKDLLSKTVEYQNQINQKELGVDSVQQQKKRAI